MKIPFGIPIPDAVRLYAVVVRASLRLSVRLCVVLWRGLCTSLGCGHTDPPRVQLERSVTRVRRRVSGGLSPDLSLGSRLGGVRSARRGSDRPDRTRGAGIRSPARGGSATGRDHPDPPPRAHRPCAPTGEARATPTPGRRRRAPLESIPIVDTEPLEGDARHGAASTCGLRCGHPHRRETGRRRRARRGPARARFRFCRVAFRVSLCRQPGLSPTP